ncbi:MAG TPA: hypothetical protein VE870_15240 [Bacteroidales bacterium]|nr:hypothetical protein [Bacteroidales bacterium]
MKGALSVILFFCAVAAFAQNHPGTSMDRQIELMPSLSVLNYASADELYSPMVYEGRGLYAGIRITFSRENSHHIIEAGYSDFTRKSEELTVPENYFLDENRFLELHNYFIDLSYSYLHQLSSISIPSAHFSISGELSHHIVLDEDVQVYPEISITSVSPGFEFGYSPGSHHTIKIAASVPLFSIYLRNNYSTAYPQIYEKYKQEYFIKHNVKFAGPGTLRAVKAEAGYTYSLGKRMALTARYRFGFLYLEDPRPLRWVSGLYTAGLTYRL